MTSNLNEVLNQATKKIAGLIQKSFGKSGTASSKTGGRHGEDLDYLLRGTTGLD
jgi:hypothetical protein